MIPYGFSYTLTIFSIYFTYYFYICLGLFWGSPPFWVPSFLSFLSFWARCGPVVVTRYIGSLTLNAEGLVYYMIYMVLSGVVSLV